ncbi:MAG TPA: sugar phosphate isomerase/epimerase family protein [Chloroflexota bacterium]|nr:sugar phosphate isomerase/epimerase family protein [Chloroflexota bacterium]
MIIGAMNHPMRSVVSEIRRFRELGFDFIDLTLEPEKARPDRLDPLEISAALRASGLGIVGHTAWYLPIGSPFDRVREAAIEEMVVCFDLFARLGAKLINVHPDPRVPSLFPRDWIVQRNVDSLGRLSGLAEERGVRLMLENLPGLFNAVDPLQGMFEALPEIGWHLDVGHANLGTATNVSGALIDALGSRLCHVHLSDNKGGDADLHLPLGAGTIDWTWAVDLLRRHGYDDTITLEVFSPDVDYLTASRRKLRALWDA